MVDGITQKNENMEDIGGDTKETRSTREERVNGEKTIDANQLEEKIVEEQSEKPAWKINVRQMQAEVIQEHVSLQMFNEDQKKLDNSENNTCKMFEFNLQLNLLKDSLYEEKRSTIQYQVEWIYDNVLYIDNRCGNAKPDCIDTALNEVEKNVQIRHQWKRHGNTWEGAIAVFQKLDNVIEAQRRLSYSRYLTAANMQEIFTMLIDAELRYPDSDDPGTIVIIRRKKPLPHCLQRWIAAELKQFGEVLNVEYEPHTCRGLQSMVQIFQSRHIGKVNFRTI